MMQPKHLLVIALLFSITTIYGQLSPYNIYRSEDGMARAKLFFQAQGVDDSDMQSVFTGVDDKSNKLRIYLFGNGGIRNSFTGDNGEDNSPSGSIGLSFVTKKSSELVMGFTVNDFNTTDISDQQVFGTALLIPDLSGRSFSTSYQRLYNSSTIGFRGELQIANSKWKINNVEYDSSPLLFRTSLVWLPFGINEDDENKVSIEYSIGISHRSILGGLNDEKAILKEFLSVEDTSFTGIEIGAALNLGSTRVFISIPFLGGKDTEGITGSQVSIGATLSGNMIKIL